MRLGRRLAYCLGSFANTLCDQARTRIIYFYNVEAGLPPAYTGLMWGIYGFWNAVNDPLLGQLTDRTRSRWGRRVPYLLFGAIPLGIAFFLLWTPPEAIRGAAPLGNNAGAPTAPPASLWPLAFYFFSTLFIFDALFTITLLAYNALYTEMTVTPRDRASLSALREGLGVVGLIVASLVPLLAGSIGYSGMGAVLGLATAAGYLISVVGVPRVHHENPDQHEPGFVESFTLTYRNVPFRWFLGASLCREIIFIIPPATLGYYCRYVVPLDPLRETLMLLLPFLLTFFFLWVGSWITPRLGVRRAWIVAFASFLPGCILMLFARSYLVAQLGTILIAPGLAGLMMLPHMQISEIIDDDTRRIGKGRAGAYYGVNGALGKLSIVFHATVLWMISRSTGFVTRSFENPNPVQPETAITGIRFMMGGMPVIVSLLGIFFLFFLRLPPAPSDDGSGER